MKPYYILLLVPTLLYGCAMSHVTDARLYDFNSGMLGSARFYDIDQQHGDITATLHDGEELRGEFTQTNQHPSSLPRTAQIDFDQPPIVSREGGTADTAPHHADKTLAGVFGFSPDVKARPVGIATLTGKKGTVLQIVIYDLDTNRGTGSGVGLDNKGNWYFVRLGI